MVEVPRTEVPMRCARLTPSLLAALSLFGVACGSGTVGLGEDRFQFGVHGSSGVFLMRATRSRS